jgi:hypothetical protein
MKCHIGAKLSVRPNVAISVKKLRFRYTRMKYHRGMKRNSETKVPFHQKNLHFIMLGQSNAARWDKNPKLSWPKL